MVNFRDQMTLYPQLEITNNERYSLVRVLTLKVHPSVIDAFPHGRGSVEMSLHLDKWSIKEEIDVCDFNQAINTTAFVLSAGDSLKHPSSWRSKRSGLKVQSGLSIGLMLVLRIVVLKNDRGSLSWLEDLQSFALWPVLPQVQQVSLALKRRETTNESFLPEIIVAIRRVAQASSFATCSRTSWPFSLLTTVSMVVAP
ncbi:hypothetical protein T459_23251 [Capsicum annuum]|uniref:Uncharacterized protein n=1 Tax=Capsicum annuum TaxID=4072 RepID=A0A2G2YRT7_CAPAN|nr:hypothetical protein T459_23251 [Capsicum annuum]